MISGDRKLRVAVVSAVKHDYVARGIASHPRFQMTVVCDDPDVPTWAHQRNQLLADEFSIPYVANVDEAFDKFDLDVAVISSEACRHAGLSMRAARKGLHIVQDKPISLNRKDAHELVETIRATNVKFMMWNRNFLPAILQAKEQVDAGAVGKVLAVHCDFYFAKDAGPPKGTRRPGYPPMDWLTHQIAAHVDGSDGGLGPEPIGELANEGIYPLGYIFALTPARPLRVFATSTAHFHQLNVDNQVEDLAGVTLQMTDGVVATIAVGRIGLASHPSGGEIKVRVIGTEGSLVIREACPDVAIHYRNQSPTEARQRRVANENDFLLAEHFATAIDQDAQPFMNVEDGWMVYKTIEAALESSRSYQMVDVREIE